MSYHAALSRCHGIRPRTLPHVAILRPKPLLSPWLLLPVPLVPHALNRPRPLPAVRRPHLLSRAAIDPCRPCRPDDIPLAPSFAVTCTEIFRHPSAICRDNRPLVPAAISPRRMSLEGWRQPFRSA